MHFSWFTDALFFLTPPSFSHTTIPCSSPPIKFIFLQMSKVKSGAPCDITGCDRVYAVSPSTSSDDSAKTSPAPDLSRQSVFRYILEFANEEDALRKQSASTLKKMASSMGIECAPRSTRATIAKRIMTHKYLPATPSTSE